MHALCTLSDAARLQMGELLLQHGADCLAPVSSINRDSLLVFYAVKQPKGAFAALVLAHLERQRANGQLQLGSTARAAQLLLAALRWGHQRLVIHSLRCLEEQLSAASGAPPADAAVLRDILAAAIEDDSSSSPAGLQALLATSLPLDLDAFSSHSVSLVAQAARSGSSCAAKVRLLAQADAPLTAADLLHAIDRLAAPEVAALLSAGSRPAVNTAQTSQTVRGAASYSCPIHRALDTLVRGPKPRPAAQSPPLNRVRWKPGRHFQCCLVPSGNACWRGQGPFGYK